MTKNVQNLLNQLTNIYHAQPILLSLLKNRGDTSETIRWTLTISLLAHLFLVLGISFVMPTDSQNQSFSPPLKITLVMPTNKVLKENPEATTLAQINQSGEEDVDTTAILATGAPLPPQRQQEATPQDQPLLADETDPTKSASAQKIDQSNEANRQLLTNDINLAYLNSQARPREKFVSANTKESMFASYIERWRLAVEKVGNLNYPDAAKQQKLEGSLVLDVTLRSDGSIDKVDLLRSSGHKVLDDGAERIVYLSAPFDVFTKQMSAEIDKLHIIRTWKFGRNRVTSTNTE